MPGSISEAYKIGSCARKRSDYFENSRRATYVQREYAERNPHGFEGYGENCWGFTACDGPGAKTLRVRRQRPPLFRLCRSRRAVWTGRWNDRAIGGARIAAIRTRASLSACAPFLRAISGDRREYRLPSGFNPTLAGKGPHGWVSEGYFGLDQGIIVLMIENYRSQLIWKLMRQCPYIRQDSNAPGSGADGYSKLIFCSVECPMPHDNC